MSWDLKLALNISHYAICLVLKKKIKKNLEMNQQRFSFKKKKKKEIFQLTGEGNNTVHGTRGKKKTSKHLRVPGWGGSAQ